MPGFRERLLSDYFDTPAVHEHDDDEPSDRRRARDVVQYERQWRHGFNLELREHSTAKIFDQAVDGTIIGERDISRIKVLGDEEFARLIGTFLLTVPSGVQLDEGTFGVNFFRTYTNVVTKPHRDNQAFVILYLINRIGEGAANVLIADPQEYGHIQYPEEQRTEQLDPGDILIFSDPYLKHNALPLIPPSDGRQAQRDMLVCTIDHPLTYGVGEYPIGIE